MGIVESEVAGQARQIDVFRENEHQQDSDAALGSALRQGDPLETLAIFLKTRQTVVAIPNGHVP